MDVLTEILSKSLIALTQLVILSAIVVCITNGVKRVINIKDSQTAKVAFIFSLAVTLVTGCGILKAFNFDVFMPSFLLFFVANEIAFLVMSILYFVVDWIGTGFFISKGSNAIHDLLKRIKPIDVSGDNEKKKDDGNVQGELL